MSESPSGLAGEEVAQVSRPKKIHVIHISTRPAIHNASAADADASLAILPREAEAAFGASNGGQISHNFLGSWTMLSEDTRQTGPVEEFQRRQPISEMPDRCLKLEEHGTVELRRLEAQYHMLNLIRL